jgi:hypothetical protein
VTESARERADHSKSEISPEAQRTFVCRNDEVELHRPKAATPSFMQTMFRHGSPDPATSGGWQNHEAGVSDMRSEPRLVGFENVTTNYSLIG